MGLQLLRMMSLSSGAQHHEVFPRSVSIAFGHSEKIWLFLEAQGLMLEVATKFQEERHLTETTRFLNPLGLSANCGEQVVMWGT